MRLPVVSPMSENPRSLMLSGILPIGVQMIGNYDEVDHRRHSGKRWLSNETTGLSSARDTPGIS
jgi:hypothetical protein